MRQERMLYTCWGESMKLKRIIVWYLAAALLVGVTGIVAWIRYVQLAEQAERLQQQAIVEAEQTKMQVTETYYPLSIADGLITQEDGRGVVLLDAQQFLEHVNRRIGHSGGNSQLDCYLQEAVNPDDLLILEFQAHTASQYVDMTVTCGAVANTITVGPVPSQYYIPVTGLRAVEYLSFSQEYRNYEFDPVTLGNVRLINYGQQFSVTQLRTGQYELGSFDTVSIDADQSVLDDAVEVLVSGQKLFRVRDGVLEIYDKNNNQLISSVSGLGDTRDMCFTKDENAVIVVSRGSGVYFVSVADAHNPYILSHYDSLELCTDLCVDGDYAYIASRYFGIEILDIHDLKNPRYITRVQSEQYSEYQDCLVEDGILYVGLYADKRVDIFDVHDFGNICQVSSINLRACGQGLAMKDRILFVATGLFLGNTSHGSDIREYGTGAGNGMEVYDLSDPASPKFLSRVALDGRMFSYSNIDEWDVVLSGDKALICGMGCGLYVYDISDPARPVRDKVYQVVAKSSSEKYIREYAIDQSNPSVYPYDTAKERHGWVTGIAMEKGNAYLVTHDMGVYRISGEWCEAAPQKKAWTPSGVQVSKDVPEVEGYRVSRLSFSDSVWAVCQISDSVMAVAAGEGGIQLITKDLQPVSGLDTRCSVRDIRYQNGYLYTAESEDGLGIYQIDENNQLIPVGRITEAAYNSCFASIAVTPDDAFVIAHSAFGRYTVINVSDKTQPFVVKLSNRGPIGNLYYRTLSTGLVAGKYIGVVGSSGIHWLYSENGEIHYLKDTSGRSGLESQGLAAAGENCILISTNGYRYWNPELGNISQNHEMTPEWFNGKAVVAGNMLVVTRNFDGKVCIVDITHLDSPGIVACMDFDCAIDVPCIIDDTIWLPCRYDGLLKLEAE